MKWVRLNPDGTTIDVLFMENPEQTDVIEVADEVNADWTLVDNVWTPPINIIEEIVPESISRRQLLIGLTMEGIITPEEAVAAASTGALPSIMQTIVNALPIEQQIIAKITWASMMVCELDNPLLNTALQYLQRSENDRDTFFKNYSKI